jgi:hypothetical protein
MYVMVAPNGETLVARNEEQKQVMLRAGFVEQKATRGRPPKSE